MKDLLAVIPRGLKE